MTYLDRKKSFGEVFGANSNIKYRYEQDGRFFNAQGEEVTQQGVKVIIQPLAPPPETPAAAAAETSAAVEEPPTNPLAVPSAAAPNTKGSPKPKTKRPS